MTDDIIYGIESTPAGTPIDTWDYTKDWPTDDNVDPDSENTFSWQTKWCFIEIYWPWDGGRKYGRRASIGVDVGVYVGQGLYAISLEGRRSG